MWVWILDQPLTSPVMLGKSFDIFVSLCLHVLNRVGSIGYLKELFKD